jgi:hypothetical protein
MISIKRWILPELSLIGVLSSGKFGGFQITGKKGDKNPQNGLFGRKGGYCWNMALSHNVYYGKLDKLFSFQLVISRFFCCFAGLPRLLLCPQIGEN